MTNRDQCTKERFLNDVKNHQIHVIRDDGVNRHIRFKRPESTNMYFDLLTWKGHLCYTGDMGTYVFSRVDDMFTFFRGDLDQEFGINPNYWGEKLLAISRFGEGYTQFNSELFKEHVLEDYQLYFENTERDEEDMEEIRERLDWEVLDFIDDAGPEELINRAIGFSATDDGTEPVFQDFWEHNFEVYTFHYLWCCYALVWGVAKYDLHRWNQLLKDQADGLDFSFETAEPVIECLKHSNPAIYKTVAMVKNSKVVAGGGTI